jgi:hypothetical protein
MPFPAALQLQLMSKLQQPNTTPVTSILSYDTRTPSLSSIDANSVSMLSIDGSPLGQNVISLLYLPRPSSLFLLVLPTNYLDIRNILNRLDLN